MQIKRTEDGGVTIVEVSGTVRLGESARQFTSELQRVLGDTDGGAVIDFTRIDYLDSTGIGELVGYLQKFTKSGRRLALFRPHHRLEALLKLTRLDAIFPIFWELDEALSFVRSEAAGT
jgi:anti-sigma B factor antagonist